MKFSIFLFSIIILTACKADGIKRPIDLEKYPYHIEIPFAGNTYTKYPKFQDLITNEGISSWNNNEAIWDIYFYLEEAGNYYLALESSGNQASTLSFKSNNQNTEIITETNLKNPQRIGQFELLKGYNKIQIKGNSSQSTYPQLIKLHLYSDNSIVANYVKENANNRFYWGRRGPSVHLSYQVPENKNIEYYYTEMMIPEGMDPVGSYFMANGFAQGYFGIQVNSHTERRVLFSVWSPYQTDNPNEIPDDYKIKLLRKGENVNTGAFGGEGSGGQSYRIFNWKAGIKYGFLTRAKPDGNGNTIFTSYIRELGKDWQLIASFERPHTDTWYTRPHGFLENFIDHSGYLERKVLYNTTWAYTVDKEWIELTKVKFTTDEIGKLRYRKDLSGGIEEDKFYLKNGGFFNGEVEPNSEFELNPTNNKPDIDFDKLP